MDTEKIEEILKNIGAEEIPADVDKIAQETSNNFTSSLKQTRQPKRIILLEQIMRSRITKFAAAAVIFIAVIAGLPLLDGKQGVALADVLAKIEQARAYMYKLKMATTGNLITGMPSEQEVAVTVSNDYGIKWETDKTDPNTGEKIFQQMYVLPKRKMVLGLMPEIKQYMRMELDDDWLAGMKKKNNDPREVVKQIMNCDYTELGRSVIDGIKVEGFQTTDTTYFGGATKDGTFTLWVDVDTWLPVRSELVFKMDEQTQVTEVTYDYLWNIAVDAREFEPVIPDDFTAFMTDGMKMPGMNEQAAIEGLRLFAKIAGRYPESIDMIELAKEIAALAQGSDNQTYLIDELKKLKEELSRTQMTEEEIRSAVMRKSMEIVQPLRSPSMFYRMLVVDKKEPVYYGRTVAPDDADAVLLRWKISEDEYRIIFGDLSVGSATAEELANLEQQ